MKWSSYLIDHLDQYPMHGFPHVVTAYAASHPKTDSLLSRRETKPPPHLAMKPAILAAAFLALPLLAAAQQTSTVTVLPTLTSTGTALPTQVISGRCTFQYVLKARHACGLALTRCTRGYELCPDFSHCCQSGSACFRNGTCGKPEDLSCMPQETLCGKHSRCCGESSD